MTPQEHLDASENLLSQASNYDTDADRAVTQMLSVWALAHAVTALAIELGVPHSTPPAGGDQGG